ncbi:MAG TPA: PQQ-dependent sugar dehydrogenase [Gaiellaceae bacterium]|nr:PQQ-dependent sugar dehydrogenase [Gaiellaceae bacterium]
MRGRGAAAGLALALELLAVAVVAAGCAGAEKRSETPFLPLSPEPVALVRVAGGFEAPVQAVVAPGRPGRLHVVEQTGRIRVLDTETGAVEPSPLLDLTDLVTAGGEQGLLALAFHPGFPSDPRLYAHYSDLEGDTRVVEYRAAGAAVEPVRELLHFEQPYENHNGGQLAFGPDGLLYLGLGDGGAAFDPEGRSQDLSTLLGKLLRLDVDRPEAEWEIAAYGLRNPWRFSFDRETGDLWIGDVGQDLWEEVNVVPRGTDELLNFGWDVYEGDDRVEDKELSGDGRLVGPVAVYGHDVGCSITGGFVYRGSGVPALAGRYLYGDYCSGTIWSLRLEAGEADVRREPIEVPQLTSFAEDEDGELYAVSQEGTVYRLASAAPE